MAQNPSDILAALEADLQPIAQEPEEMVRPEPKARKERTDEMPPIVLAAAGLAVFDAIICLVYLVVWAASPQTILAIVHAMAGVSLLLGVCAIVVAGIIFSKNTQTGVEMPGTPFALWAMISGGLMILLTLMVPLVSAIQALVGGDGS